MNKNWMPTMVVMLVLTATLLAACGGKQAPITVPTGSQAGDLTMAPCTYEQDDVEYAADCGTVVVPENRNDPGARLIALPVTRVRATAENPAEPIFWLTGGPGSSNMRFSHWRGCSTTTTFFTAGARLRSTISTSPPRPAAAVERAASVCQAASSPACSAPI